MSADNWAKCPRCASTARAGLEKRQTEIVASYGSVSIEEFDRLRAEVADMWEAFNKDDAYQTFREDYEIYGAEDGEVKVTYRGGCGECNLRLTFEHSHPLDVGGDS